MKNNIISIYSNDTPMSSAIAESLINKFRDEEYYLKEEFDEAFDLHRWRRSHIKCSAYI